MNAPETLRLLSERMPDIRLLFGVRVDLATEGALRKEIRPAVERELIHVP